MTRPVALVLGGSLLQTDLVRAFHDLGVRVLVCDQDPACPGASLADAFEPVSTRDRLAVLEAARRHGVTAIQTAGTDCGDVVAWVAGVLDLPAVSYAAAITAKDKGRMREALGLPHPRFTYDPRDVLGPETPNFLRPPFVLKPTMLSASRGVRVIHDPGEVVALVGNRDYSAGWILEELLGDPGPAHLEAALDLAVVSGKPRIVNSARRVFSPTTPGLELGHVNPAWLTLADVPPQVHALAERAARLLGVDCGPFKLDLIYDPRPSYGWCLLEAATRWSGSFDHAGTARLAREVDYSLALAEFALLGAFPDEVLTAMEKPPVRGAASFCPILAPGRLITEDLKFAYSSSPGVSAVHVLAPSYPPDPISTLAARPLHVLTSGPTPDAAWEAALEADAFRTRLDRSENPHEGGGAG